MAGGTDMAGDTASGPPERSEDTAARPAPAWSAARLAAFRLPGAEALNPPIAAAFARLAPEDFERRSHFFGGRFENLYLDRCRIPALAQVLDWAQTCAAAHLGQDPAHLKSGFWLNAMDPGHSTTRHTHDDADELLSAVYYIAAAPASGDLLLWDGPMTLRLCPEPGLLLLFPPDLPHAVEPNLSPLPRLSVAINFGPADRPPA